MGPSPCTTVSTAKPASIPTLTGVQTAMVKVPPYPFGMVAARSGDWSFVSGGIAGYAAVMSDRGFAPRLVRVVKLPVSGGALGASLAADGRYLLIAGNAQEGPEQAVVLSVSRLEAGQPHSVLGVLKSPLDTAFEGNIVRSGAIEVTASKDGRFVFVADEGVGIAVFNLQHALATRFASSGYVGTIPMNPGIVGMALSPDGRTLYATSERGNAPTFSASQNGTLNIINVARAESQPQHAVVSTANAGCVPVRVAISPDGKTLWVTDRGSDQLLAFSSQALIRNPKHAFLAAVSVGTAPVGVTTFDNGRRIAIADSNRFNVPGATSGLTIVNADAALDGTPSLIGEIPAGGFPRELTVEPNGTTLLATNYSSGQVEAVDIQHVG